MNQKEAIIAALEKLGGKASINDIYTHAFPLADWSGSKDWKATLRWYLQKDSTSFRSSKRGWWELVSYQEEVANLQQQIVDLEVLLEAKDKVIEELKRIPTEDAFVQKFVEMVEMMLESSDDAVKEIRKVFVSLGRKDAAKLLGAWMKGQKTPSVADAIEHQTEALLRVAERPTTVYEAGSTHEDQRRQLFVERDAGPDKLLEQSYE